MKLQPSTPLTWGIDALCSEIDTEIFFPAAGASNQAAKQVCALCPVAAECLSYALDAGVEGIWGGTTDKDRMRIRRRVQQEQEPRAVEPARGPGRPATPEPQVEAILTMRNQGMSYRFIAREIGIPLSTVAGICQRTGTAA